MISLCMFSNTLPLLPGGSRMRKVYFYDISSAHWGNCADLNNVFFGNLVTMNGRLFASTMDKNSEQVIERYIPCGSSRWQEFVIFPYLGLLPKTVIYGPVLLNSSEIHRYDH